MATINSSHTNNRLHGRSPIAFKFTKMWHEQYDIERSYLDKVDRKMKKWANKKRCHIEYKSLRPMHKGLVKRYEGLFPYLGRSTRCPIKLSYHQVKWKGLPESKASWDPSDALWQFQEQIERFQVEVVTRISAT
ncbi:hypothetical protein AAG906_000057 [Vitis piasezkii]